MYGDTKISFHHESSSSLEKQNTHHKIWDGNVFCIIQSPRNLLWKYSILLSDIYSMLGVGGSD